MESHLATYDLMCQLIWNIDYHANPLIVMFVIEDDIILISLAISLIIDDEDKSIYKSHEDMAIDLV
jgi:hypothetical protein